MKTRVRWLFAAGLCLLSLAGAGGGETRAAPLVTSDVKTEWAATRGAAVVRAVAASEAKVTSRHGAHMSTRMGKISGGGMVSWASCRQRFTVAGVLAGSGRMGQRDLSYSYLERATGFPLPRPRRPVARGEKVVLVLEVDGSLVKVIPDTDEHRKEIETITRYIKDRPPAAVALLGAMKSFTLKIEYHGPKSSDHPSVWYTTSPKRPDRLPASWLVRQNLSDVWAHQALDHLVKTGLLAPESLRAEQKKPRPRQPYYSLALSAEGVKEVSFSLGWGKEARKRLESLARAIQYDAGTIARVLAKLPADSDR